MFLVILVFGIIVGIAELLWMIVYCFCGVVFEILFLPFTIVSDLITLIGGRYNEK